MPFSKKAVFHRELARVKKMKRPPIADLTHSGVIRAGIAGVKNGFDRKCLRRILLEPVLGFGFDSAVEDLRDGLWQAGKYGKEPHFKARWDQAYPEFRRSVAEHEFGEIFSHEVGNALEMLYVEKHGLMEDYLEWTQRISKREFQKIAKKQKGFERFRKYFRKS